MRKTLRATTAILACLHLVSPLPLFAQNSATEEVLEECGEGVASAQDCMRETLDALDAVDLDETSQDPAGTDDAAEIPSQDVPLDGASSDADGVADTTDGEGSDPAATPETVPGVDAPLDGETGEQPAPSEDGVEIEMPELNDISDVEVELGDSPAQANEGADERSSGADSPDGAMEGGEDTMTVAGDAAGDDGATASSGGDAAQGSMDEEQSGTAAPTGDGQTIPGSGTGSSSSAGPSADSTPPSSDPDASSTDNSVEAQVDPAGSEDSDAGTIDPDDPDGTQAAETSPADPMTTGADGGQTDGSATQNVRSPESGENSDVSSGAEVDAAATAAATDEGSEPAETVTETISEEESRSSSEDFGTAIDRSPSDDGDDDRDGLSNLERALIVGAGALAVGAILNNNREVVASSDDRVVISGDGGDLQLLKDDNALLRQPGNEVTTETYADGSTRSVVERGDGSRIITIRDPQLRVIRRVRETPDGEQISLIDDTEDVTPVDREALQTTTQQSRTVDLADEQALRDALATQSAFDRTYSLAQVRDIAEVRQQVPAVDLDNITFETGSAAIRPEQAESLIELGRYISGEIDADPSEVFLVEGHTDAVGDAAYNLALSDRRAESVALALTEYFGVPPENLVVQGYGERFLKVPSEAAEPANRRATVRQITPLLRSARTE